MRTTTVTLQLEIKDESGDFREVTTYKATPAGLDLDQVKSKLRVLAEELEGQGRLDLDDEGKP